MNFSADFLDDLNAFLGHERSRAHRVLHHLTRFNGEFLRRSQFQDAFAEVIKNRTTLVIAHRLSTIENADQVIVLEQGRVIETGTHQELLEHGQAYSRLYQTQFGNENNGAA